MNEHLPMIDDDGEVRELSAVDMKLFRPASEVLPPDLYADLIALNQQHKVRGAQKAPTKVTTTIRLDADILAALRALGKGWQTRVNDAMREWLKTHSIA